VTICWGDYRSIVLLKQNGPDHLIAVGYTYQSQAFLLLQCYMTKSHVKIQNLLMFAYLISYAVIAVVVVVSVAVVIHACLLGDS